MPLFDTSDGLISTQEGANVRARAGVLNYQFSGYDRERIADIYWQSVVFVRDHFRTNWRGYDGPNLSQDGFDDLTQEIALDWMFYHIVNRLAVSVTVEDMRHPMTNRKVRKHASKYFGEDSIEAVLFASHFLGISRADYSNWMKGDDIFSNR